MITVSIKKKTKKLESIVTSLRKIDGKKTQIGYFKNQGMHVGKDMIPDYSYVALAQAIEIGYFPVQGKVTVPMPFMRSIFERTIMGMGRSTKVRRAFQKWGKRLDKKASPQILLDAVGEYAKMQSLSVFNNKAYFPQAPNNMSPVFETGELMSKFTYRTTHDNRVRRT